MKGGFYSGGTFGIPTPVGGIGGGLYVDNYGNFYPQLYYGTPKGGASAGYTPDLEGLLTGPSVSGTLGGKSFGYNFGRSADSIGVGLGTPGVGATYGFGPFSTKGIGDAFRPRTDEYGQPFPGVNTTAPPLSNSKSGSEGATSGNNDLVSRFLESFRPRTDEFGNPFPERGGDISQTIDANGSAAPLAGDNRRYLGRRVAGHASAFDTSASAVPFVSSSGSLSPRSPNSLDGQLLELEFGNRHNDEARIALPGLFTRQSMLDWSVPPPLFNVSDRSGARNGSVEDREAQRGTGIPFLDEYIRYLNQ